MTLFQKLKAYKKSQEFFPGALSYCLHPFYIARVGLVKGVRQIAPHLNGRILDVGCGSKPYKSLFTFTEYVGMDVNQEGHDHTNEDIDVFYDGKVFPFPDESFDSVINSQVLEHVFTPADFLNEINRVLKPGGKFLLTVPFIWYEHEQPWDFGRYSSFGLKSLLEKHGFKIVQFHKGTPGTSVMFQFYLAYINHKFFTRSFIVNTVLALIFVFPAHLFHSIVKRILPKMDEMYLDNIVYAVKEKSSLSR